MNKSCADIYREEIDKQIMVLKKFREAWLNSSFVPGNDLFQYGDDDFYFYRFAVSREEAGTFLFLDRLIYRVLERFEVDFVIPDDVTNAPFDFIIIDNGKKLGFKFEDFYADEDVNAILDDYDVCFAYHILTLKDTNCSHIERQNKQYSKDGVRMQEITLKDFFFRYCSEESYINFEKAIEGYIAESKKILGYQSIKFLSSMNLSARKAFEEKILLEWKYQTSKYQIIDCNNAKIQKQLYLRNQDLKELLKNIEIDYLDNGVYKAMLGEEDFAESFITSEWLYYSLKGMSNFDYTAIVSGYLKSIEQLLYKIVMLNIDNGCVISLKGDQIKAAKTNSVIIYEISKTGRRIVDVNNERIPKYPYVDFSSNQVGYMDSSIGTFEFFLRNNPHIFANSQMTKLICDMISCFRTECRNGYFHTHNLNDMLIVEKTRSNAILLYAVLLGCVKQVSIKKNMLGIIEIDNFSRICRDIRKIRHYNTNFIFEYENAIEKKMIYDSINNTPEYGENGIEHYEELIFYEVPDFSEESYDLAYSTKNQEWKVVLTIDNLPKRIYCYDTKKEIHELDMSK